MQTVNSIFIKAWEDASNKGYDHVVIAIDLHGTIIDTKIFNTTPGSFEDKVRASILRPAITALQKLSVHPSISMFIYSGTRKCHLRKLIDILRDQYRINIDLEYSSNIQHASQSFKRKPYYSILLDDKAGFDPDVDWDEINSFTRNLSLL